MKAVMRVAKPLSGKIARFFFSVTTEEGNVQGREALVIRPARKALVPLH
jgi:hypothetical protein